MRKPPLRGNAGGSLNTLYESESTMTTETQQREYERETDRVCEQVIASITATIDAAATVERLRCVRERVRQAVMR